MLLFIDNIFRFTQAGSEVSALLGRILAGGGFQPTTLATPRWAMQERILHQQGLDHLGAGDLCAGRRPDRPTAPATSFAHLDTTVLSRYRYRWVNTGGRPAGLTSRILDPQVIGDEHYTVARRVQEVLHGNTRR